MHAVFRLNAHIGLFIEPAMKPTLVALNPFRIAYPGFGGVLEINPYPRMLDNLFLAQTIMSYLGVWQEAATVSIALYRGRVACPLYSSEPNESCLELCLFLKPKAELLRLVILFFDSKQHVLCVGCGGAA